MNFRIKHINMNDNIGAEDKALRGTAMAVLNALQRLVVVIGNIDKALEIGVVAPESRERLVFARNALCLTANIWNEHLSGNVGRLYRASGSVTLPAASPEHESFYKERMPRSIRFAAKELQIMNIPNVENFVENESEIRSVMAQYAVQYAEIATYLKKHQENIDDIPMLDMLELDMMPQTDHKSA